MVVHLLKTGMTVMNRSLYVPIVVVSLCAILGVAILPLINQKKKLGEMNYVAYWNPAEKAFLQKSGREPIYEGEYFPIIETANVCELGKLTAISFIDWINENPNGVISLPTGKTPELFIEYLKYYKDHWNEPRVQKDLAFYGIKIKNFPETKGLKFVQLDEFYPIEAEQRNSFISYIKTNYLSLLEIPEENLLTMDFCNRGILRDKGSKALFPAGRVDLTLMNREPHGSQEDLQKIALLEVEEFCRAYERQIAEWGGIGFFLGGIGPDGHVAFNMQGSQHDSKTRLVTLNYMSAAAAAGDLGGIEFSRGRTAVTIGLGTITANPNATIIILAAGEAKAKVIASAVQNPKDRKYPATALQGMKGARFYLTRGSASQLEARGLEDIQKKKWSEFRDNEIDDVVIGVALKEGKRVIDLTKENFLGDPKGALLIKKYKGGNIRDLLNVVRSRLTQKIERGLKLPVHTSILHTSPHHDDVELSYYPLIKRLLKKNQNEFVYLTSGFNSVTNQYMAKTLERIPDHSLGSYSPEIFRHDYAFILQRYLNEAENGDEAGMARTESFILLKNICNIYGVKDVQGLREKIQFIRGYFVNKEPGEKDTIEIQRLKGAMRESETERMLLMAGVPLPNILHLRAKFYNGDYFNPMPTIEQDALPMVELYKKTDPKIITVAFDPEGTGPDTHYKVLQVVAEAVRRGDFDQTLKVWGYRNVWHRFKFSEGDLMFPISDDDMKTMHEAFMLCFSTQKSASFPAAEHDGPFSELAVKIQKDQFQQLRVLLGEGYFLHHPNPLIQNAGGFIFIKEMNKEDFIKSAVELKSRIEMI